VNESAQVTSGYRQAREITRRHAKTFHFASHALPPDRRAAALALYAFCRRLDDLVDTPGLGWCTADLGERLERARTLVRSLYGSGPPGPVPAPFDADELAALRDSVGRWGIPEAPFQELITGVGMDLTVRRYETFADLDVYCHRVAGTVGLLMAPVLGCRDPAALAAAADLGRAMQLTNILRDVREDLERDRVYLPQAELAAAGLTEGDLAAGCADARFRAFMRGQVARARRYYVRGLAGVPALAGWRCRLTVRLMAAVYGDLLRVIEAQDYDVFRTRAVVPARRKLVLAATALRAPGTA
jgi:15-cis-phytoene synthase